MDEQLKHFSHEHPLMYKEESPPKNEASGEPVSCSACGEPVLGPNYSCNQCSEEFIILHKPCAQLGRENQHPNAHAWQLSTSSIEGDDYESDDAEEIRHFSHQHLFVAKDYHHEVKDDRLLTCQGCIRPITEDFYSCTKQEEQSCQFYLHKICARLPEKMLLPLLHQHHFTLLSRAPSIDGVYQCYMCGIFHHGFVYSCEKCALPTGENLFYLDLECIMYWENRDLKHESHAHRLLLDGF